MRRSDAYRIPNVSGIVLSRTMSACTSGAKSIATQTAVANQMATRTTAWVFTPTV